MVDFVRKRLQVFVSSTFEDLRQERQAAVEAILSAGHIPAGMELFAAGDESQMEVIKQWIDESDAYLLILAGRYGSIDPRSGKSYTQLEYEYAASIGKPVFACVVKDLAQETRIKQFGSSVIEKENPQKLKEFRALVLSKMSKFWEDTKDIKLTILETMNEFARRDDLLGWVRPRHEPDMPKLTDEMARLSDENARLRGQLATINKEKVLNGLRESEIILLLKNKQLLEFIRKNRSKIYSGEIPMSSEVAELVGLGILEKNISVASEWYRPSREGIPIINRLELETAASTILGPT